MVTFQKGAHPNVIDYPLTQEQIDNLQPCRLVNPMVGNSYGYRIPEDFDIDVSTDEIERVRIQVQNGAYPYEFLKKYYPYKSEFGELPMDITGPLKLEGLSKDDPKGLANVVHMDMPSDMPKACLRWLLSQGANVKRHTGTYVHFLQSVPEVEDEIGRDIMSAMRKVFRMKYHFGLARPEEISEHGKMCTAYDEGCPNHASFPAGHSAAAAGGVLAVIDDFELTHAQLKELLDTAYLWGMFRSLAGVHHAIDNVCGLMACGLEKYMDKDLVEKYKA